MKKYFVALLLVGIVTFGAHTARAYTLTDLYNQIANLTKEVTSLKANLGAAAVTSTYSTTYGTTVLPTIPTVPIDEPGTTLPGSDKCLSTTSPWIKVLSPNGGEVYQAGQKITVKWISCNIPMTAKVHMGLTWIDSLRGPDGVTLDATINDGQETYILPSEVGGSWYYKAGKLYKIKVTQSSNNLPNPRGPSDESDNLFSINAVSTTPSVPSFPAGCTSSTGYSTTTGKSCGCNGTKYSTYNGQLCPVTTPTPPTVVSSTKLCNAQLLYPHPNAIYTPQSNPTPGGDTIIVDTFLLVHAYPVDGCMWNTYGSLVPTSNPNAGSAGSIGVVPTGQTEPYSFQPMVILGNLNFGQPTYGDRIYHQQIAFHRSQHANGTYTIQVQSSGQPPISQRITVPVKINW